MLSSASFFCKKVAVGVIIEVENAINVYNNINEYNPLSIKALLSVHKLLLDNLIKENGQWRTRGVGIISKNVISHVAPQAHRVGGLMNALFEFLLHDKSSWLIKACVFHYELEFIHPFADGNGRIGRLWQQLLLMKEDQIFEYLVLLLFFVFAYLR